MKSILYLGPDHVWAHEVLAKALGTPLEAAKSEAEMMFHAPGSYDLIFFDLTGAVEGFWQSVVARLAYHGVGLAVIVVSPKPDWREARLVIPLGATFYIEKMPTVKLLADELDLAKAAGSLHRR